MRGIIRLRVVKFAAAALAGLVFVCVAGFWVLHQYPSIGAYGSDSLRYIFGDQMVAAMETVLYQVQDRANQVEYRLGMLHPADPFSKVEASPLVKSGPTAPGASPSQPVPTRAAGSSANKVLKILPPTPAPKDTQPQATIQPDVWTPPQMQPLGTQPDEGIWQPYIRSASGQIVAYRSFVQPDPTRPYASVGVVAFDLQAVRLHYVIGFEEPYASKQLAKQQGSIPAADMNGLIAAFNGGFKFRHGHFGSMAEGFTSVPMRDGLSAMAVYQDGTVKIGAWGKDVTAAPDLIAVRQNGPLLTQDGNISGQVDNPSL